MQSNVSFTNFVWHLLAGYVYMNGDTGKLSAGAVYTTSTDSSLTGPTESQAGTAILTSPSSNNIHFNNNNNNNNINLNSNASSIMSQSQFGPRVANNCVQVPTNNDYSNVNGVMANTAGGSNIALNMTSNYDGAASTATIDAYPIADMSAANATAATATTTDASTNVTTAEGAVMSLDQLKQMLLTQLEYYFSR